MTVKPQKLPEYEVFALHYATHEGRRSHENFLGADPHDSSPMPLDFYVWVLRDAERVIVVDTGFTAETAMRRGRRYLQSPEALLRRLGVDAADVQTVILTHMHYDHAGNLRCFPNATVHMQEAEIRFCTGRCMCHQQLRHPFEIDDVTTVIQRLYDGRVRFSDGTSEIAPGVSVHRIGGHTDGLQAVRVNTERGPIVLASDAAHYWANLIEARPFPIVLDVGAMLDGHQTLLTLGGDPDHVIPGHDPLVRLRFPVVDENIVGLHWEPRVRGVQVLGTQDVTSLTEVLS